MEALFTRTSVRQGFGGADLEQAGVAACWPVVGAGGQLPGVAPSL
jgi:hypothetical protein